jgi:integrase
VTRSFNPLKPFPCCYFKHGAYWLVKRGKWERIGSTLAEATAEYVRRTTAAKTGGMPALIEKVFAHHTPKLAEGTCDIYRAVSDRVSLQLREFEPGQVRGKHIAAIKLKLVDTPVMANHTVSWLRTVFAYAVEWQLVDTNPCIGIKPYPVRKRARYLADAEYAAIRAKAGPRLAVIMDLLYLTGQRVSDVLAVRRGDLTDAGIAFTPEKTANSTQARLVVQWSDELRATVAAALALQGKVPSLYLLHNRSRKPLTYSAVRQQWDAACLAAGVEDAHMHDIRAKALTDAKAQGHNATALAAHADPKMTERYIRLRETPLVQGPTFARKA